MNKITFKKFTDAQVKQLLKNKNVLKYCGTYFAYTKDFKIKAVNQYLNEGMLPKRIFEQAGFDLKVIGKDKPKYLMQDWLEIFRKKGVNWLKAENRGKKATGRKPRRKLNEELIETSAEKIKRLELDVLYLKKENDFLVQLRAKRAE